jgi:dTDP-4-dehydrorhamnose 3,5-epimerase
MNIKIEKTDLAGVLLIQPEFFEDERGFFYESYRRDKFEQAGLDLSFVQDNHSRSRAKVIRGLHFQDTRTPQYRLVRCPVGEILDVVVDLRIGSPTCGQWRGFRLSGAAKNQLLIPPEFAHGFAVLSDVAEVQYKVSAHHNPAAEHCLRWDDPDVGIQWPIKDPVISEKDRTARMTWKAYLAAPLFHDNGRAAGANVESGSRQRV